LPVGDAKAMGAAAAAARNRRREKVPCDVMPKNLARGIHRRAAPGSVGRSTVLGDTGTGELIRWGRTWYRHQISGKLRSEIQVSPGFAEHFPVPPQSG
jgi:hypothetical protein